MVDQQFINQLLVTYGNYLPLEHIHAIRSRLEATRHDEAMLQIIFSQLKDPTISLILSILLGPLGIDRFFIGDIGLGIGKLITDYRHLLYHGCHPSKERLQVDATAIRRSLSCLAARGLAPALGKTPRQAGIPLRKAAPIYWRLVLCAPLPGASRDGCT